jgi:homoserine kinase type II
MAVFTPLEKQDIQQFLSHYNVGELVRFEGILQGVDNTNYKIETTNGKYILTIFENRIDPNDLPFFLNFMSHLKANGIVCPTPAHPSPQPSPMRGEDLGGGDSTILSLKNKPASLFSFLEGRDVKQNDITPALCHELGILLGKMHMAGQSFPETRKNSMSFDAWEARFHKIGHVANPYMETLQHLKTKWPQDLPRGAVHLDLFPDNVFIKDNHIYGVIDFYFSATDFLAYDLAIVLNAWCFDGNKFNQEKWQMLLSGYESIRPLTTEEKESFQILCQGAALRFLSSRLHDYLFHDPKNLVIPKPPDEYIEKLEFHKHAKLF